MIISRRLQAVALAVSLLMGAAGSSSMLLFQKGRDFDLVASANPATPKTSDVDRTAMFERAHGKRVQADAVATSSALCDSCHGTATAVQVISIGKARKATADNTATAWSNCHSCGATSVSVQVVLARPSTTLTVRNRALAANATCTGCSTAAIAIQIVLIAPKHQTLSRAARAQLESLATDLEAQLRTATRTKAARTTMAKDKPGLADIKTLLQRELEPSSVRPSFDFKTG
jgi:hypothetical protein